MTTESHARKGTRSVLLRGRDGHSRHRDHEIAQGVTPRTANLSSNCQPGAMDEPFADLYDLPTGGDCLE